MFDFLRFFLFDLVLNFTAGLCNRFWLLWHLSFLSVTQRIGPPTVSALPVTSRNSSSHSKVCPESSSSFSGFYELV